MINHSPQPRSIVFISGEYPPDPGGVGAYTRCLVEALQAQGHRPSVLTLRAGRLVQVHADGTAQLLPNMPAQLDWSPRGWPALIAALDTLRPTWVHVQYQTGAYGMQPGVNLLPWRLRGLTVGPRQRLVERLPRRRKRLGSDLQSPPARAEQAAQAGFASVARGLSRRAGDVDVALGLTGRPRIAVTFHDLLVPYLFPKAGPLRQWVNQRLARDADALVATNRADAAGLRRLAPRGPAPHLIPIGSNIAPTPPAAYTRETWRAGLGVAPDELLVAYFGLLGASKGVDVLLDALARLPKPWRLLLIGGAATAPEDRAHAQDLQAQIDALDLRSHLIAPGHVPEAQVSAHLLAADCVALPFRDGASFRRGSLLAALAHGCAVVTTQPADPADAVALAQASLLVPIADPAALAAALGRLADEPMLRQQLGTAGRTLAASFSWAAIAAAHAQMYQ